MIDVLPLFLPDGATIADHYKRHVNGAEPKWRFHLQYLSVNDEFKVSPGIGISSKPSSIHSRQQRSIC